MAAARILILGCGYTGKRVARLLRERGHEVIGTARDVASLLGVTPTALPVDVERPETLDELDRAVTAETLVLYSLPTIGSSDLTPSVMPHIRNARRIVYLSTTGVYGAQRDVDYNAAVAPRTAREWLRVQAEETIRASFADSLVLRPAAIYGPGRGIHAAMLAGKYQLAGDGTNFVSRIHVDDLATHCVAGLFSDSSGAWPVADDCPCTSGEIAEFCAKLLKIPLPKTIEPQQLSETRRADRRVDGSAIRHQLKIELRFPSYRLGIPACIAVESDSAECAKAETGNAESGNDDAVDRAF